MRHVRVFLSLALALVWLGSSTGLAARPQAADHSAVQTMEPGQVSIGLPPSEWQKIQAQVTKLTAADGAEQDQFGISVSVSGDTAVVGTMWADVGGTHDQGAAYVFYRDQGGADAWGQMAKLTAADGLADDHFGSSVSVSGDTVVVGAELADVGSNAYHGAVYVFCRDQGGPDAWGQVAKLTIDDGGVSEVFFGSSVSTSGDTVIVGAWKADVGGSLDQGAAYVFYRDQGGPDAWGQVAKLTGADSSAYDAFGIGVSLSGDTAIVGAWNAWVGSNYGQGTAYVFYRNQGGADAWGQVAKLIAADGTETDNFGYSVSVSGDTAVVGARWAGVGDNWEQGAAYVFYRNQGGADAWGQVAKLTAADGAGGDHFGNSVSVSGGTAIVGMDSVDPFDVDPGAAYVYYRDLNGADAWGQAAKLTADDGERWDRFGTSVSASGLTAVIGAHGADNARGAAYVYALPPGASGDAYTTDEDMALQVSAALGILADDIDPQGDPLTAVLDAAPSHGTLDLRVDGSFTYTPTADFAGLDTFTYYANDGQENSDAATAAITVTPVNDAPETANDAYSTAMDWLLTVDRPGVLLNDTDVEDDPLTAALDNGPSHGTLNLRANGSFTYSPAADWSGVDTFTYRANDGAAGSNVATVEITVLPPIYLPLVSRGG